MRFSRISGIFLVVLVTSLGTKVAMQNQPTPLDPARLERALAAEFGRHGYSVSFEQRAWGIIARTQKASCLMIVVQRASDGSTKDRIGQMVQPFGRLRHVYRGQITVDPPRFDPFIRDRIVSQLQQFGVRAGRSPVLAVAASPRCDLNQIDWSRLANIP